MASPRTAKLTRSYGFASDYAAACMLENTINISNRKERVRDIMVLFEKCKDDAVSVFTENRALKEEVAALTQKLVEMNAAKETAEFAALAAARPRQSAR